MQTLFWQNQVLYCNFHGLREMDRRSGRYQQNKQHEIIQNMVSDGFAECVAGDCQSTFHGGKVFNAEAQSIKNEADYLFA